MPVATGPTPGPGQDETDRSSPIPSDLTLPGRQAQLWPDPDRDVDITQARTQSPVLRIGGCRVEVAHDDQRFGVRQSVDTRAQPADRGVPVPAIECDREAHGRGDLSIRPGNDGHRVREDADPTRCRASRRARVGVSKADRSMIGNAPRTPTPSGPGSGTR